MSTRISRFTLEWWIVPKRLIYIVVALVLLSLAAGGAGVYVYLHGSPFAGVAADDSLTAGARFDSFEGGVRVVRASTRETVMVRSDTRLLPGDTVQTLEDGRARITLADGSTLMVKPNSVITIAENNAAPDGKRANVRVAVGQGQINVRTEQQEEGGSNVVGTRLTESRLSPETTASFDVRADKSEAIRVSTGAVETSTRNGDKTTLRHGEYVGVNPQGNIAQRERLLDVPSPSAPRNLERIALRRGDSTSVSLRWQRPVSGTPSHYRVEVATSPFFVAAGKVIERDQLEANEFTVDSLRLGNYFWRVRAVTPSGQVSDWSDPQKFLITPPGGTGEGVSVSDVTFEYVAGSVYLVRGRTQAGNTVRCAGRETLAGADGTFQLQITAPKGTREILLSARDPQGNDQSFRVPFLTDAGGR